MVSRGSALEGQADEVPAAKKYLCDSLYSVLTANRCPFFSRQHSIFSSTGISDLLFILTLFTMSDCKNFVHCGMG